jgi:uncharacterized membrane protein (DUF4010 family)
VVVKSALALVVATLVGDLSAYELETHAAISKVASNASVLASPEVLSRLGLRPLSINDRQQTFTNSKRERQTLSGLIEFGARW